jgi:glycosyltransferase involved in cell wall biosynthesis
MLDRLATAGTETQLLALIRHLDRSRVRPQLCLLDGMSEESRAMEPEDCPVLRLGVRRLRSRHSVRQLQAFVRHLRSERIDILQLYSHRDSAVIGCAAGRLAGVRHILRVRNNLGHWMTPVDRWLFRVLNWVITGTLTNCLAGRVAAIEQEHIRPDTIVVIENGVDTGSFADAEREHPARSDRPPTVGLVANLRAVKGVDVFLEAAAVVRRDFPEARFLIAGDGEERQALEQRASRPDLAGSVTFLGRVREIPAFLQGLDVAALSSRAEGLSNALIEYLAAGVPVVATAVGAASELIDDGVHGRLVPPGDPAAFAAAVSGLLRDPARARALGQAGRDRIGQRFDPQARARKFAELYRQVVSNGTVVKAAAVSTVSERP